MYKRAWHLFKMFASSYSIPFQGMGSLPLSRQTVAAFIAYLHSTSFAPTTITSYTSALGHVHKLLGLYDPTTSALVQKLLVAANRINPTQDARLPLTQTILLRLMGAIDIMESGYRARVLLKAMFSVAFYGLMRVGEITKDKNKPPAINLDQISFSQGNFIISIKQFKHNVMGQPVEIVIKPQHQRELCPVQLLAEYLRIRDTADGPLF